MISWLRKKPRWDAGRITSPWFDSHFNFAANRITEWLGFAPELSFGPDSRLTLLDFGCGGAITTLGVALRFPNSQVIGVDIGDKFNQLPAMAREQVGLSRLPPNLVLQQIEPLQPLAGRWRPDAVFSWSVFEHLPRDQVPTIIADLYAALRPGGVFFLQIEPLYLSPWGSHLRRFVDVPWAHLLWPKEQLRQAVMAYDGEIPPQHRGHNYEVMGMEEFKRFHLAEFDSLNGCTADDMLEYVEAAGFEVIREQRQTLELEPDAALLERYRRRDLQTNGILLLARKP